MMKMQIKYDCLKKIAYTELGIFCITFKFHPVFIVHLSKYTNKSFPKLSNFSLSDRQPEALLLAVTPTREQAFAQR